MTNPKDLLKRKIREAVSFYTAQFGPKRMCEALREVANEIEHSANHGSRIN
jgi:hypothetical protein